MNLFSKIDKHFHNQYLTTFWHDKNKILTKAVKILIETIILDDKDLSENERKYNIHINKYEENIGKIYVKKILEWGGGYGGLCHELNKRKSFETYIIIDLPVMCYIQYYYLKNMVKDKEINLITIENMVIKDGCVNLISLPFITKIDTDYLKSDMFISTWGLSESGMESFKFVNNHNFLKSKKILLAFNYRQNEDFPFTKIKVKHSIDVPIDTNNKYVFK